ncbi:MAG: hypothetical protein QOK43_843 [Acidimicrobiaceae bacterium]|nr:hypothetical protein [Acidimicrobiaceae bacterium]MDQ1444792.1 hypothetical protein [Acidimicrobiaceae bacterium]
MEVRIGVTYAPKEIELEFPEDADRDALVKQVEQAIASDAILWLTDRRGRRVGIPSAKVAYVEISGRDDERRVGFSSG